MNAKQLNTNTYGELQDGSLFKVLEDEYHSIKIRGNRATARVPNHGIYVKVGNSHAINIATHEDCIFSLKTECRVITARNQFDLSKLPDWELVNRGNPNNG